MSIFYASAQVLVLFNWMTLHLACIFWEDNAGIFRAVYLFSVSVNTYLYNFWISFMCKRLACKFCSHPIKTTLKWKTKRSSSLLLLLLLLLLIYFCYYWFSFVILILVQINKSVKMRHGGIAGWKKMLCPFIRWSNTWHTPASRWPRIVSISC